MNYRSLTNEQLDTLYKAAVNEIYSETDKQIFVGKTIRYQSLRQIVSELEEIMPERVQNNIPLLVSELLQIDPRKVIKGTPWIEDIYGD